MSFVRPEGYTLEEGLASVKPEWAPLVREAFDALPEGCKITQVKAKWGELRIYFEGPNDNTVDGYQWYQNLLFDLEKRSGEIG